MADGAGGVWDVVKLIIAAFLGGAASVYLQRRIPRDALRTALKADARGALRFAKAQLPLFDIAEKAASRIEKKLLDQSDGRSVTFDDVTALSEGWVITAPVADLIGHGQRFDTPDEAYAVTKYLHFWNLIVGLEARYRGAVDKFLEALPKMSGDPSVSPLVLREYLVRIKETAGELTRNTLLLRAQADHFFDGRIEPLSEDAEKKAEASKSNGAERA